jgi:hypothetical protein
MVTQQTIVGAMVALGVLVAQLVTTHIPLVMVVPRIRRITTLGRLMVVAVVLVVIWIHQTTMETFMVRVEGMELCGLYGVQTAHSHQLIQEIYNEIIYSN